jgi:hypothetical protein
MSVSSIGSSNPNAYLQSLLQPDNADPTAAVAPSDPLQALYQAITGGGGQPSDPLVAAATSSGDGLAASSGAPQFSPDVMKALLSVQGNQTAHGGHHHHSAEGAGEQGGAGGAGGSDPLQALLSSATADGATSQSGTNADGSSTTTITYADGTKVEMTTPAAASTAAAASTNPEAPNFANLLKQLISLQAQYATPTMSMSI